MRQTFELIFGVEHNVSLAQMCARAFIVFLYGLLMLRLSGRRTFAQFSAVDMVISFIVGSALSRAMTGSAPFPSVLAAVGVLVGLHVAVSHAIARSRILSMIVEGQPVRIARDGVLDERARRRQMISQFDLEETLRSQGLDGLRDMAKVKQLTVEPSGKISVLKRN